MRKMCYGPVLSFDGVVKASPRGPEPDLSKKRYTLADVSDALRDLGEKVARYGIPRRSADAIAPGLWDQQQYSQLRKMNARFRDFWKRR